MTRNGDTHFSVVIPMFNAEKTIDRTLWSVLNQSCLPSEIVIVDDGSTDASVAMVSQIGSTIQRDPRYADFSLTILSESNRGVGEARNTGISSAKTEWVALLDADDLWYPDHLEELGELVRLEPTAGLVSTSIKESSIFDLIERERLVRTRAGIDYFRAAARSELVVHSSSVAVRRSVVLESGGFGPWRRGEDLEMWARIALRYPVGHSTHRTAIYHRHARSEMAKPSAPLTQLPATIADLSPSCATVFNSLKTGDHMVEADSSIAYLNSRIASAVRHRLAENDASGAKHIARLALEHDRGLVLWATELLPRWTLQGLCTARSFLKRLIDFVRVR